MWATQFPFASADGHRGLQLTLFRHSNFNIVSEIFGGKSIEIRVGKFIDSCTALMHHGYDAGLVDEDDVFAFVVFLACGEVVA